MPERRPPKSSTPRDRPRGDRKDVHTRDQTHARRDDRGRVQRTERSAPASRYGAAHLSDDVVKDLRATARPGKEDILVKVFSEAVAAYFEGDFKEAIRLGDQCKHMALRS